MVVWGIGRAWGSDDVRPGSRSLMSQWLGMEKHLGGRKWVGSFLFTPEVQFVTLLVQNPLAWMKQWNQH